MAHHSMYFSNDKIVRKNFFVISIIALPFGRRQPLLGLFHFIVDPLLKWFFVSSPGYGRAGVFSLVTPWSLFRIGSVSKPITAMGVLKLLELNQVKLNSKIFGPTGSLIIFPSFCNIFDLILRNIWVIIKNAFLKLSMTQIISKEFN